MSAALLELQGVQTHIGAYHILHGVDLVVPEGQVTGAVKVGNTLVVGGSFNYVGPPTGPFAIADGANATNFNTAAGLTGIVTEVVSDGASGWFAVEGVPGSSDSGKLVHVAADGRRDAGFAPPANLDMKISKTSFK